MRPNLITSRIQNKIYINPNSSLTLNGSILKNQHDQNYFLGCSRSQELLESLFLNISCSFLPPLLDSKNILSKTAQFLRPEQYAARACKTLVKNPINPHFIVLTYILLLFVSLLVSLYRWVVVHSSCIRFYYEFHMFSSSFQMF